MFRHIVYSCIACGSICVPCVAQTGTQPDRTHTPQSKTERFLTWVGENIAAPAVQGMAEEGGRRLTNYLLPPQPDGSVSASVYSGLLERLAAQDAQHRDELTRMRAELREKMSRAEVHSLTMRYLEGMNKDLAELVRKFNDQQRMLEVHSSILAEQRDDIRSLFHGQEKISQEILGFRAAVDEEFERQGSRIGFVEEEMASLRQDYPRYKPSEQGEHLGVAGMRFLEKRDFQESLRSFRFAHAYDPGEPCYLYGMALAYRGLGENGEAEVYAARGIAADRKRSLFYSTVWTNMSYRIQGKDRVWLSALRSDPMYGVKVPGMIRIPDSLLTR